MCIEGGNISFIPCDIIRLASSHISQRNQQCRSLRTRCSQQPRRRRRAKRGESFDSIDDDRPKVPMHLDGEKDLFTALQKLELQWRGSDRGADEERANFQDDIWGNGWEDVEETEVPSPEEFFVAETLNAKLPNDPFSDVKGHSNGPENLPPENDVTTRGDDVLQTDTEEKRKLSSIEQWKANTGAWRVVHLGTSSAIPTRKRNVSAVAVVVSEGPSKSPLMMIQDAGEGVSNRLVNARWCGIRGFGWIRYILITHVHGDHIYGLPNLLHSIGQYYTLRKREREEQGTAGNFMDNSDEEQDPVIQIFAPYGVRGLLRVATHMMTNIGVRFAVRELIPRDSDFSHIGWRDMWRPLNNSLFDEEEQAAGLNARTWSPRVEGVPGPHAEEVFMDNIIASEDGTWKLVDTDKIRVVAAPLKHRVPCFGYIYEEKIESTGDNSGPNGTVEQPSERQLDLNLDLARELGVRGRQYSVLRSGRPVTIKSTGRTVYPEDVVLGKAEVVDNQKSDCLSVHRKPRKVVILGDTCDSSLAEDAAQDADVLVHEATFSAKLADKARIAMHSTGEMAGAFAKRINADRLILTHFSSRYEAFLTKAVAPEGAIRHNAESEYEPFYGSDLAVANGEESTMTSRDQQGLSGADSNDIDADFEEDGNGDDSFENDDDEEEDFVSMDELVSEAKSAFCSDSVVAAYDYFEYDILR